MAYQVPLIEPRNKSIRGEWSTLGINMTHEKFHTKDISMSQVQSHEFHYNIG